MELGKGSYGTVRLVEGCAVKTFNKLPRLVQEYAALSYVSDCPHVVRVRGVRYQTKELVMEAYEMSFRAWLDSGGVEDESGYMTILRDLLLGLVELHDRGLAHGDIKPGNILVSTKPLRAVLGDVGFVSVTKHSKVKRTASTYRDPVVENSSSHDIYSVGIILLELFGGVRVLAQLSYREVWELAKEHVIRKYRPLVLSLLSDCHSSRPSARDLVRELFSETVPPYSPREIVVKTVLDSSTALAMRERMRQMCKKANIKRGNVGYRALLAHLSGRDTRLHEVVMLLILAALFGEPRVEVSDAKSWSGKSERQVLSALEELTSSKTVLDILFVQIGLLRAPTELSE